jgi:hypothetical protein
MKITFDNKTSLPKFVLEKKDLKDANAISEMMKTEGWKILKDYLTVARESLIDAGKDGISTRAKRDLSDIKFACIKGFDEAFLIPDRIVLRAEQFIEESKKNKEEQYAPVNDDE